MPETLPSARPITAATNPFAQQRLEQLAYRFPDGQGWESNLARLRALGGRATIVGAFGSGKSTLLRQLHQRLLESSTPSLPASILLDVPRRVSIRNRSGTSRKAQNAWLRAQLAQSHPQVWILVDGLERLSWPDRWLLVHRHASPTRCAGLVLTVHSQPWLTWLPAWVRTRPTHILLDQLLDELEVTDPAWHQRASALWNEAGRSSIRDVLRQLYDEYRQGRIRCPHPHLKPPPPAAHTAKLRENNHWRF